MTMSKTAYIDFDGTIVDVFPRYYGILSEYLRGFTNESLDFPKYKKLKRLGKKDHVIVKELIEEIEIDIDDYIKFKRQNLESFEWLSKDILIGNPEVTNMELKGLGYNVVLLTQRNNQNNLIKQLDFLSIKDSFDQIIMVKPEIGKNVKFDHIIKHCNSNDIIIGDSIVEINAANLLNIDGYFVETGLFSSEVLGIREFVFDNYKSAVDYILNKNVEGGISNGI